MTVSSASCARASTLSARAAPRSSARAVAIAQASIAFSQFLESRLRADPRRGRADAQQRLYELATHPGVGWSGVLLVVVGFWSAVVAGLHALL